MIPSPVSIYQSLLEINNILVREVTPDGLFSCLAKYFQTHFGCDRVSLTIYQSETDTLYWFALAEGVTITQMDSDNLPLRGPLARMAIETKQPIIVPRLEEHGDYKAVQFMLDAGLRSAMAFPLISRGKAIAAVVVSFKRHLGEEAQRLSDILEKMSSQVALAVDNMLIHAKLNQQNKYLNEQVESLLKADDITHSGSRFFYNCPTMQNIMKQIRSLANSDVPILISGETGTGKEFIARFIHKYSHRANFNFVKVNCPALSPTLFESELFGHAKGAFTGASSRRLGRFELADKGSIFLDEIGELDIILQAKLLHVLQDAKFERVGESKSISVDTRYISATNADLYRMMHEGKFRRDLFYRMGVATVQVPPLRDREGELLPILNHLLTLHSNDMQRKPIVFHRKTLEMLQTYDWPGNVRELSNLVARLQILHSGDVIGPEHVLPLLEANSAPDRILNIERMQTVPAVHPVFPTDVQSSSNTLADVEKKHIEEVLKQTRGRVSGSQGAAKLLNVPRSTLQYKLKKHGISPRDYMR